MLHVFLFPSFFTAGAITGVVIVGVGIVVAVFIAFFFRRKLLKLLKNIRPHIAGMLEFIGSDVIIDDVIFLSLILLGPRDIEPGQLNDDPRVKVQSQTEEDFGEHIIHCNYYSRTKSFPL